MEGGKKNNNRISEWENYTKEMREGSAAKN